MLVLQGCTVYRTPTSLGEAVLKEDRVKIYTVQGKKIKYKKIIYKNGEFYGEKRKSGDSVQVRISVDDVDNVRLKNKSASIWVNMWVLLLLYLLVQ